MDGIGVCILQKGESKSELQFYGNWERISRLRFHLLALGILNTISNISLGTNVRRVPKEWPQFQQFILAVKIGGLLKNCSSNSFF
jgi:hypothetical protein